MNSSKRLIINVDDYGLCREVNQAVEQLAMAKHLGGVSVLANGECWTNATECLRVYPELSAGIHLNAVEGKAVSGAPEIGILVENDGSFIKFGALVRRWLLQPRAVARAVEIEWRAQIERLLEAGVTITHADSHQHLHAFPPAFRCAVKLCRQYGIKAIRLPDERSNSSARRLGAAGLRLSLKLSLISCPDFDLRHNDHFLGFKHAGGYDLKELIADLQTVPSGLTELAVHPSTVNGYPYSHYRSRSELEALLSNQFADQLARLGIELCTWREAVENAKHAK